MPTSHVAPEGSGGFGSLGDSARVFAALGDPTRLAVMARLSRHGPASIASLAAESTVTRQAIAKHLRVLAHARLVRGNRCGRESVWELEAQGFAIARRFLAAMSRRWDERLARLKSAVED